MPAHGNSGVYTTEKGRMAWHIQRMAAKLIDMDLLPTSTCVVAVWGVHMCVYLCVKVCVCIAVIGIL